MILTDDETSTVIRALEFAIAYEDISESHHVLATAKAECRHNMAQFETLFLRLVASSYGPGEATS